jgi:hypothetical protein
MQDNTSPPEFGIIIIGDEILSGKRQDKHLAKCIELLAERGLSLSYADYVGDDPERITRTLKRAFDHSGVVFSCGGIGATPDDHTRQCAAHALGLELQLHPEAEALIRERTREVALENGLPYEPDRPDNLHRLNMGRFPAGASIIPNPYNKIAGFTCQGAGGGVSDDLIAALEEACLDKIRPSLTLIRDLTVAEGLARAAGRGEIEARFEAKGAAFHDRLRSGFLAIAAAEPDRCCVIDAAQSMDGVEAAIWQRVQAHLATIRP